GRAVLFWEQADAEVAVGTPLNVLVGPEGGFSPAEATLAMTHGITVGSLGPRILRAETAAIAAVTVALHNSGGLGNCGRSSQVFKGGA
ncbi:MAG: RsmE family RNA methyltransferase, partial [Candidatus Xenobia bacterium]